MYVIQNAFVPGISKYSIPTARWLDSVTMAAAVNLSAACQLDLPCAKKIADRDTDFCDPAHRLPAGD
jgi:hypothetical protein